MAAPHMLSAARAAEAILSARHPDQVFIITVSDDEPAGAPESTEPEVNE